jgi:Sel1 repeat
MLPFATALPVSPENAFAGDPSITIKYLPGKYYEQQALGAVEHKDYRKALELYEKAGYWGNKIAQYDAGMLYLHGADGVPADPIRGIAWLGIAAQIHADYMDKAVGEAYGAATAQQRAAASAMFKELIVDYSDKVTLDRASKRFNAQYLRDKGQINGPPEYTTIIYGNFGGGGGDADTSAMISQVDKTAQTPDSRNVNAARFLSAVKDQFSDFIHVQFGAVTVGEPESVAEREERAPVKDKADK